MEKFKSLQEADSKRPRSTNERRTDTIRYAREHSVVKTACPAPFSGFVTIGVRESPESFATSTADSSLGILCKRAGQLDHYHTAGSGHRRRMGKQCRNFFRSCNGYHCKRVEANARDAGAGAVCLGR